jgi:phospholipase/carboxylesterase
MTNHNMPELPLRHEALSPRTPSAQPPLLVLLHGYGSNEEDLLQLAPYLPEACQIVSLRAPLMLAPGSNCWYELAFTQTGIVADTTQALQSLAILRETYHAAIAQYACDPDRVAVVGFSQGAGMAGMLALCEPTIRCSVLLSGLNPFAMLPTSEITVPYPKVLVVHGSYDEVVPVATGHACRDAFVEHGATVQYAEYPIGHTIDLRVIAALTSYLAAHL